MRNLKITMLAAVVPGALLAVPVQAETTSADARALILQTLSITKVTDLDFGAVLPGGSTGTVVVTPSLAASRTCTGVTCVGAYTAASFIVTGAPLQDVSFSSDASVTISELGGDDMDVTSLTPSETSANLGVSASHTFYVGGTLNVDSGQNTGLYSGSFDVTADYQ